MKIIRCADELRRELKAQAGKSVGLVPTMGFLHAGHISLVNASRENTDLTVVSVFVNPTQFGPNEDFDSYPRDEARDAELLRAAGADIMFVPTVSEMYPEGNSTDIVLTSGIKTKLCAKTRPTHFDGVTNVVARLLCLVKPDKAFFGRKDAQQLAIITRLTRDMLIGTQIVGCPIVRERDGLAMSSRNTYLSESERASALSISRSIKKAAEDIAKGKALASVRDGVSAEISASGGRVDYVEIVDPGTLEEIDDGGMGFSGDYLLAVAAYFGKTRLIDNIARIDGKCI